MLRIKSVNCLSTQLSLHSNRSYHYHDCHDLESLIVTNIWLWLIKNPHCNKVLVIREKNHELLETDLSQTSASTILVNYNPTEENSIIWTPLFDPVDSVVGTKLTLEDSEGNRWEITVERKDKKDSGCPQFAQAFRLRLQNPKNPEAGCKSACSVDDRLISIFSLEATWDVDSLPLIAEFKKQVYYRVFNTSDERSDEHLDEILIVDQSRDSRRCCHNEAKVELAGDLGSSLSPISRSIFLILLHSNIIFNINVVKYQRKDNDKRDNVDTRKSASDEMACLRTAATALGFAISNTQLLYLSRLSASIVRDLTHSYKGRSGSNNQNHSLAERNNFNLFVAASASCSDAAGLSSRNRTLSSSVSDKERVRVKAIPCSAEGISVLEFFSGIGGMRLALPDNIRGIPVRKIEAYDCSDTANDVYSANFDRTDDAGKSRKILGPVHARGKLNRVLIDGLQLRDVEGKADVWTMSPPCQPYTTTKGAHQLDGEDNRSRPFIHLMSLLRQMVERPRWIVLENVKGFLHSDVLRYWKTVLHACGYLWRQFLLSPVSSVGLPNHRMRYYMIAEYANGGEHISAFLDGIRLDEATTGERQIEEADCERQSPLDSKNEVCGGDIDVEADQRGGSSCALDQERDMRSGARQCVTQKKDPRTDYTEKLCLSLPPMISRQYPTSPRKIEEFILSRSDISLKDRDILKVPISALSAWWAPKRLSIVGKHCRRSYCFTHSYGRLYDMSSGSLFYEEALGPLSEKEFAVDRTQLPSYYGSIRRFHPDELLAISGFPSGFVWSREGKQLSLEKCSGCVGNSVNVTVVRCVMQVLFGQGGIDIETVKS